VPAGEFRVMALDVGQGSSIVVDTSNHRLLFDAGPRYPSGFDLGAAVVVPSIGATGARRLDVMVLSHSDLDHRGGAQSVLDALAPARVFESVPGPAAERCTAGISWRWDGVTFSFLSPSAAIPWANDNDGSCVLEIGNARERVLLPGDISAAVERRLLREANPVRLLFAPHHGSNTSSSNAFVRILHPDVVFVSAGKANRYGHPHGAVMRRYRAIDATVQITGEAGALVWESHRPREVQSYRFDRGAYWTTGR
jgi:competence protein ComEC